MSILLTSFSVEITTTVCIDYHKHYGNQRANRFKLTHFTDSVSLLAMVTQEYVTSTHDGIQIRGLSSITIVSIDGSNFLKFDVTLVDSPTSDMVDWRLT